MTIIHLYNKKGLTHHFKQKRMFFQCIGNFNEVYPAARIKLKFKFLGFKIHEVDKICPKVEPQFCSKFFVDVPFWVCKFSKSFNWSRNYGSGDFVNKEVVYESK